jgi:glycosyltransferase involved in cell wall biosynthesis
MTGFVLANADHVVTKAEYQVEFVRETFAVSPDFTTVPTGVDFNDFNPTKAYSEHITEVLNISDESLTEDNDVVLYLAKLLPKKGPDQVLRLVNQADDRLPPDIKFVFVGEFRDASFEQEFHELQHAVSERTLLFSQRVSFNDVSKLLNSADAVVLLSKSGTEGVPRILQESCAMQTPLVASNVTGIAGAFDDLPGCYLINRDDPQEFTSAVSQAVIDSPQMPRGLFADRFDMYKNYAKYAEVYKTLSTPNQSE